MIMARSHRLFDLMQVLRRHRMAVSGEVLANEMGVSLRTIRRDIATLQGMGADITGEPGIGYVMKPGFLLPPLSFTDEEIQALVIGGQWVSRQADDALTAAMRNALAKITAVLPAQARLHVDDDAFYVGVREKPTAAIELGALRRALRDQCKLRIVLSVDNAPKTPQVVWPIMLAFIDGKRYISAWCELDSVYRVISLHDMAEASVLTERYPRNRRQLVREWRSLRLLPCNANGEAC
jgi:predicted DNA-binding transcriptional regulator YafY